eukprot:m.685648 g.685648  ORF g.685648 m.685648 type:complete len:127 (+) comp58625_c0_seq11:1768-2148(+)
MSSPSSPGTWRVLDSNLARRRLEKKLSQEGAQPLSLSVCGSSSTAFSLDRSFNASPHPTVASSALGPSVRSSAVFDRSMSHDALSHSPLGGLLSRSRRHSAPGAARRRSQLIAGLLSRDAAKITHV